jgi:hypothetical protein
MKHPEIILDGLQIKSIEKAKLLAQALTIIEEECGIKETRITLKNVFICPWIDLSKLNETPMQELLKGILNKLK